MLIFVVFVVCRFFVVSHVGQKLRIFVSIYSNYSPKLSIWASVVFLPIVLLECLLHEQAKQCLEWTQYQTSCIVFAFLALLALLRGISSIE